MALTAKGVEKKRHILEKAAAVFTRKGYAAVTMKDIVEECGISRGGLYRYYASTREVFVDILSMGREDDQAFFAKGMADGEGAIRLLAGFLERQKEELLNIEGTLRGATYEFFLSCGNDDPYGLLRQSYAQALAILSQALDYGVARGEVTKIGADSTAELASHVIVLLEGLSIMALTRQISPGLIDSQFKMILEGLA